MNFKRDKQVEVIVFKIVAESPVFLLLKRIPSRGGFWQPVTGGVEEGETLMEAAKREVWEETGVTDFVDFLEAVYYFEFFSEKYNCHRTEHVFGAQVKEDVRIKLSSEHDAMKWCDLNDALELLEYETNKVGFKKIAEKFKGK